MFLRDKLDGTPESATVAEVPKRKVRREIHLRIDPDYRGKGPALRIDPIGTLERAAVAEIVETLGFPLRAKNIGLRGTSDCVAVAAGICEKYDWKTTETFLGDDKNLNVKMAKEVEE